MQKNYNKRRYLMDKDEIERRKKAFKEEQDKKNEQ